LLTEYVFFLIPDFHLVAALTNALAEVNFESLFYLKIPITHRKISTANENQQQETILSECKKKYLTV